MDVPYCFKTLASGVSLRNLPLLIPAPVPVLPSACICKSFSPLVALSMEAHRGDRGTSINSGAPSTTTQFMFRCMAALLYGNVPWKPKAEPAGLTSKSPPPDSGSDYEEEEEEEVVVSEALSEELECLEEEAIAGTGEGREPGDYDRRAHLFDESSRVFQVLKEREAHHSQDKDL